MSNNTLLKMLERMGYKGRMTGHGWRHTFSTQMHDKGWEINVYRVGTLKNRPLDEAPRPKVNKLESEM